MLVIVIFCMQVDVNAHWSGIVGRLHTSTDLAVVNDIPSHFTAGQLLTHVTIVGKDKNHNSLCLSLLPRLAQYVGPL